MSWHTTDVFGVPAGGRDRGASFPIYTAGAILCEGCHFENGASDTRKD